MAVGGKIKKHLEENNISQLQLSVDTKIATPKLNLALNEKRRLKFEEYETICWALGVEVGTFLTPRPPQKIGA